MAERKFTIHAGIKRNYGKHEVSYEISETIESSSSGDLRRQFAELHSYLEEQIRFYEQVSLPHTKLPDSVSPTQGNQSTGENFPLETIKVEFQDNKKRIKACGGKFVKHGVPVYEECATDLPIETLGFGVHDFRHLNLTVKVQMDGDKPKKAISIR
jgi:hypothetical protein